MAAQPAPTKAEAAQPTNQVDPQNLSINSTWTEILNAIIELEARILAMELTPNDDPDQN